MQTEKRINYEAGMINPFSHDLRKLLFEAFINARLPRVKTHITRQIDT